jgi:transposase
MLCPASDKNAQSRELANREFWDKYPPPRTKMNTHNKTPSSSHAPNVAKTNRSYLSASEKARLLRLHLLEGKPISEICEQAGTSPSNFYGWQKQLFENAATLFERSARPSSRKDDSQHARIAQLEAKLQRKEEVITMVTEELVRSKKELGAL